MISLKKAGPNRIDLELRGDVSTEMMRNFLNEFIEMSEGIVNGRMMYRIPEFALPSLGAIGVELARLPNLFSAFFKFSRCAVLSDSKWLRKVAEIEGKLFPGITIKAFRLEEEDKAEAWLAE